MLNTEARQFYDCCAAYAAALGFAIRYCEKETVQIILEANVLQPVQHQSWHGGLCIPLRKVVHFPKEEMLISALNERRKNGLPEVIHIQKFLYQRRMLTLLSRPRPELMRLTRPRNADEQNSSMKTLEALERMREATMDFSIMSDHITNTDNLLFEYVEESYDSDETVILKSFDGLRL